MAEKTIYLFELAITFYLAAMIVSITEFFRGTKATSRMMLIFAYIGFLFHTANMVVRYSAVGYIPIGSFHESAAFFSWCVILLFFFIDRRYHLGLLGSFIIPVVFALMLAAAMLPRGVKPLPPVLQSSWFSIHISLAFLGNAAFAMAFGMGLMYLIQEHYLKSKHLGGLFKRLPNLQVLDALNYRLISIGFPLMTLAIITGMVWGKSALAGFWRWDPKEVWSLITWLIYALILHMRLNTGWRGRKVAMLSVVGFLSVLFTFFGVNLLMKNAHTEFFQ